GALRPLRELVDLDAAILCHYWLFYFDAPVGQVRQCDEASFLLEPPHEFHGDITTIKPVVSGHDRVVPVLAAAQCVLLGLYQLAERRRELRLPKDLACLRGFPRLAGVWQHDSARVAPLFEPAFVALDRVRRLLFDWIAIRHADRRLEYLPQTQLSVLREHHHQPTGCTGCDRRERTILGRKPHAFGAVEVSRRSGWCHPEGVDRDDLLCSRIVDQSLSFSTP